MSKQNVNSFTKVGQALGDITKRRVKTLARYVWEEVVDRTPRDTGTLHYSWKMTAGTGTGSSWQPKPPSPRVKDYYGAPDKPDFASYSNRWSNFYLINNQPYLDSVEAKHGFIATGVKRALMRMKVKPNA